MQHQGFDPGQDTDVWCPVRDRLVTVKKDVCQGCNAHLPLPGELTLQEQMARMDTPLYKEVQQASDDWMTDGGDYGYGGEWFPSKEIDVDAVVTFVEKKLKEQREEIAANIAFERDYPARGWNSPTATKPTNLGWGDWFREGMSTAINVVHKGRSKG